VLFAGNTVWSISERVRGICVDALYKSTFTLLYYNGYMCCFGSCVQRLVLPEPALSISCRNWGQYVRIYWRYSNCYLNWCRKSKWDRNVTFICDIRFEQYCELELFFHFSVLSQAFWSFPQNARECTEGWIENSIMLTRTEGWRTWTVTVSSN